MQTQFTIGIEEEFQLVDPQTRGLRSAVSEILESRHGVLGDQLQKEMFLSMLEVGTVICRDITEARSQVISLRHEAARLATESGCHLVASGAHPFARWQDLEVTPDARYLGLTEDLQDVARSICVFGLHVHVGVDDRDRSIGLMNEVRYFLPHLLALSVNSPFYEGRDTGIRSYRSVIWSRMPRSGIPGTFTSWSDYCRFVDILQRTGSLDQPNKIWWDVRPHSRFHTLEFRVCDMPTRFEVTLALAALCQALVAKLSRLRARNLGFRTYHSALIQENRWRAMRYGVSGSLIDFGTEKEIPMRDLALELLEFVDDVVDDLGSREALQVIHSILDGGTGADRQLEVFQQSGDLRTVVDVLAEETLRGIGDGREASHQHEGKRDG